MKLHTLFDLLVDFPWNGKDHDVGRFFGRPSVREFRMFGRASGSFDPISPKAKKQL